jgi:hypothetical protein
MPSRSSCVCLFVLPLLTARTPDAPGSLQEENFMNVTTKLALTDSAGWQDAYDLFNKELFEGRLPECVVALNNASRFGTARFIPNHYRGSGGKAINGFEINPLYFYRRKLIETLTVLAYEMVYVWQWRVAGKKSRNGYRSKAWMTRIRQIGLVPFDDAHGFKSREQINCRIVKNGPFETACKRFLEEMLDIPWEKRYEEIFPAAPDRHKKPGTANKIRYACGRCGSIVWGKPNLNILCGNCNERFETRKKTKESSDVLNFLSPQGTRIERGGGRD